jgi:hypothetical protein
VLTGQVGTLITLLDACLVNGYGAKAALGWAKPYSATNAGVYRAASGTRHCLQIIDNAATAGVGREAQAMGFEVMTAYNTGTGMFPTALQQSLGLCWRKSATADATARAWTLIGDEKTFYLWMMDAGTQVTTNSFGFGEFNSYKSGDAYNTFIEGGPSFNVSAPPSYLMTGTNYGANAPSNCFILARPYHQFGSAFPASTVGPLPGVNYGSSGIAFPNGPDGATYAGSIYVTEPSVGIPIRGRIRGMYAPLHNGPFVMYDTVTNVVGMTGITLLAILSHSSGTASQVLLDTTGPW